MTSSPAQQAVRTVWKYDMALDSRPQTFDMPKGSALRHVAQQTPGLPSLQLWVEVAPPPSSDPVFMESRTFVVVGTGHPIPRGFTHHRGTVLMGQYVWHVYEGGS